MKKIHKNFNFKNFNWYDIFNLNKINKYNLHLYTYTLIH